MSFTLIIDVTFHTFVRKLAPFTKKMWDQGASWKLNLKRQAAWLQIHLCNEYHERRNYNYSWPYPQELTQKYLLNELSNRYFALNLEISKLKFKRILKHAQLHHKWERWDWNPDPQPIKAADYSCKSNLDFTTGRLKVGKRKLTKEQVFENTQLELLGLFWG